MKVYLDNAATTQLSVSTKNYLIQLLEIYGNPSSKHSVGECASNVLIESRKCVAAFINSNVSDIYFTSSGSASNTLAINGYASSHDCCILYSPIAHKSILKSVRQFKNSYPLQVYRDGLINIEDLKEWLNMTKNPFVIIDYANSEIGTIQDVKKIIDLVHFYNGIIYLDCTSSISTIPIDVKQLNVDMAGFSAHKLGGLKGCGVLFKKSNLELKPLIYGNQESGLFGGTENLLGIASLNSAIREHDYSSVSSHNRDYVYDYILKNIPNSYLVGSSKKRLAHNLYIQIEHVNGESLMILLDLNGIQVSTGSACNSKIASKSTTLSAIGMNKLDIQSCIRMTFSGKETQEELDYVCGTLLRCVESIRNMN